MYERAVNLFHGCCEVARCCVIKEVGEIKIGLCLIHVGVCRTVDDDVDALLFHHLADSLKVGDVELVVTISHIGKHECVIAVFRHTLHLMSELSVGACH